jgi:hypothetical protein
LTAYNWASVIVSVFALAVSGLTAYLSWRWRVIDQRRADLTAYFHRNSETAKVTLKPGDLRLVGYNLVLWNRGPAPARTINFHIYRGDGAELSILGIEDNEFPLPILSSNARYPIPWILSKRELGRRFRCDISWIDGSGAQFVSLPLRRGETHI